MADTPLGALLVNGSLLLAAIVAVDLFAPRGAERGGRLHQLAAGLVLGAIGVGVMLSPYVLRPGVVFDARSVLVATAAYVFGPLPAAVVVAMTATLRLLQGGLGAGVGVGIIVASAGLGLLFRRRHRGDLATTSWRELIGLGFAAHVAMLLVTLGLPRPVALDVLRSISLPVLTLYPLLTVAVGGLMVRRMRQDRLAREVTDSEARFRSMFENGHVMMFQVDPRDGAIVDANPAAVAFYGWSREQLTSMRLSDINTLTPEQIQAEMQRARQRGGHTFRFRHRRADGTIRDVEVFSGPIRLGRRELLYSLIVDVTARVRAETERATREARRENDRIAAAEAQRRARTAALNLLEDAVASRGRAEEALEALRERERLLAESQRAARIGSWQLDTATGQIAFTEEAPRIFGLPEGAVPSRLEPLRQALRSEARDRLDAWIARLQNGEEVDELVFDVDVPGDATHVVALQGGVTVRAASGATRLAGTVRDVTEETAARRGLQKLSAAVEQSPESIVITDADGVIEYVNAAFEAVSGFPAVELIGENPRILNSGKTPAATYRDMWATLTRGETWRGEFVNRRKDGGEYVEFATISPLLDPQGHITHYVAVKEDVTERKALAEELDAYRHRLEELVQARTAELEEAREHADAANAAKSRFLANMSHEIRTPMNAIVGLAHLMREDAATARLHDRVERIDQASRHLLSIINDILDLSRIEEGKLDVVDENFHLSAVLDHVRSILASEAAASGLELTVDGDHVPPWLRGDAVRLRQALLNLAGNAVKFTERGGVTLRAILDREDEAGLHVRFEVQDTGPGIPFEEQEALFEAFTQSEVTSARGQRGTGLGLAISKRLIELMGGTIGVESEVGRGATFWFELVLQRGRGPQNGEVTRDRQAQAAPGAASPGATAAGRKALGATAPGATAPLAGRRLLLAEDNAINRDVAVELLHAAGADVDTAENGAVAAELVEADPVRYDAVLMDVWMPRLDGLAATRRIREAVAGDRLPIVAMSANAFDDDRAACLAAGMNDFVAKPVDPDVLVATLLRWIPGHAVPPDASEAPSTPDVAGRDGRREPEGRTPAGLPEVEGLDVTRGLASLGGDAEAYRTMLRRFLTAHARDPDDVRLELARSDTSSARDRVHALRGVAATLGAFHLAELARAVEAALPDGAAAAAGDGPLEDRIDALDAELSRLASVAREHLAARADPSREPHDEPAAIDLAQFGTLIDRHDVHAVTLADEHPEEIRAWLGARGEQVIHALRDFDFRKAGRMLAELEPPGPEGDA